MTDNTFLPGGTAEAAPAENRRNIILLGGLGAVVLAGAGYYFLLGGSSSQDVAVSTPVVQHHVVKAPAAAPKAAAKPAKATVIPVMSTVQLGRSPFKALIVDAPAAAPGSAASSGTGTTTATGTTPTTATGSTGTATTVAPYKMTLTAVSAGANNTAREYTFSYMGMTKTVIAGQRFGVGGHVVVLAYITSSTGKVTGALVQVGDDDPIPVQIKGTFTAS